MTRLDALKELAARVEAGVPGRWTFEALGDEAEGYALDAFHGSLDAALALHDAVLPGWDVTLSIGAGYAALQEPIGANPVRGWYPGPEAITDDNPARAWLLAILRALIAQEEGQ